MIQLAPEQAKALEGQAEPLQVQNPCTQEMFVLLREDLFAPMRQWAAPLSRGWDDSALDVYNDPSA